MVVRSEFSWDVTLIGKVRRVLAGKGAGEGESLEGPSDLRRDLEVLQSRLESLRRSFPGERDLLERVGLSAYVLRLLEETRGQPVSAAGGV